MADLSNITPKLIKSLFQGLSTIKIKRSALSPLLQLCLTVTLPCVILALLGAWFELLPIAYYIFGLGAIPVVLYLMTTIFLLIFDRDRLHTEEHLERMSAMQIVEAKGQGLIMDPIDLVNIVNPTPTPKKLPPKTNKKEPSSES